MSLQFSDITNKKGIVETIDRNCKSSSVSYPLTEKAADVNLALDKAFSLIFPASGRWQFDDSNHTKYPTITTPLVANQRDYSFTTDEQGNLILDIYRVMIKNESGIYYEIYPVDTQSDRGVESLYDGQNIAGTPYRYDKTANGIFLDPVSSYSVAAGVKVFINREGSYFTSTDTVKQPGFAGIFHEYLALRPSYFYAMRNGLKNANALQAEMLQMEKDMKKYYRDRARDEQYVITSEPINSI